MVGIALHRGSRSSSCALSFPLTRFGRGVKKSWGKVVARFTILRAEWDVEAWAVNGLPARREVKTVAARGSSITTLAWTSNFGGPSGLCFELRATQHTQGDIPGETGRQTREDTQRIATCKSHSTISRARGASASPGASTFRRRLLGRLASAAKAPPRLVRVFSSARIPAAAMAAVEMLSLKLALNPFAVRSVADQGKNRSDALHKKSPLARFSIIQRRLYNMMTSAIFDQRRTMLTCTQ